MNTVQPTTPSRAGTLSRLVLALVVALVLGSMLTDGVDATKKGKNTIASVKERVRSQRDLCELIGGGTLSVSTTPFGATITDCKGGTDDGRHCVNTKKSTNCSQTLTTPPPAQPDVPPTGGVSDEPSGGGINPRGGETTQSTEGVEDPSDPSSGDPVLG